MRLGDLSRLVARLLPGSLDGESLSGRAYRHGPQSWPVRLIDALLGEGHCRVCFIWEAKERQK